MSEFGYITDQAQSRQNNKGIFSPTDIYNLTNEDKWTQTGQLELIRTQTVSSVAICDFTNIKENIYNTHFMTMTNVTNESANVYVGCVFSKDNGSNYDTANNYARSSWYIGSIGSGESRTTATGLVPLTSDASSEDKNGYIYFYNLGDSTKYSNLTSFHGEHSYLSQFLAGTHHEAVSNNAIRLKTNSGGDFSGTFSLYGVRGHE